MTSTMSSEEELVDEDDYEVGGSGGSCAVTAAISVHAATNVIAPLFPAPHKKPRHSFRFCSTRCEDPQDTRWQCRIKIQICVFFAFIFGDFHTPPLTLFQISFGERNGRWVIFRIICTFLIKLLTHRICPFVHHTNPRGIASDLEESSLMN